VQDAWKKKKNGRICGNGKRIKSRMGINGIKE
jgi:hypothetical protein